MKNPTPAVDWQSNGLRRQPGLIRFFTKESVSGYIFIMPWLIGFFGFTLLPILASLYFSLTQYNLYSAPKFIGMDNYVKMLADKNFWLALRVTFQYAFTSVPIRLVFALFVAMLLNRRSRFQGVFRVSLYLPSIIGGSIAVAVMWRRLFAQNGIVNGLLQSIGIDSQIGWLTNKDTAIWTLVLLAAWQFGSSMLIFLSGLKEIPGSYYEAAVVDGANGWQKFFKITLPMLTPTIFFNLVNQLINGFIAFNQSYIITEGKPLNLTRFYAVYLYIKAFKETQMGYSSAMAWVLLIIIALFTAIIFKTSRSWVYYESKEED